MERDRSLLHRGAIRDLAGGGVVGLDSLQFGAVVILGRFLAGRDLSIPTVLSVRFALAGTFLAAALALSRKPLLPSSGEGVRLVLLGGLFYAAESALFFFALRHGTAAAVTLLFFTY